MNIIERVKNILLTPKTEWEVIKGETATTQSLLIGYVLPFAIASAITSYLGMFISARNYRMDTEDIIIGITSGFIASILVYYITVIIVDKLASNFGSEKNIGRSAQLVVYSGTPVYVAGLLSFIPVIGFLILLASLGYFGYLMYLGLSPMKKTPEDKKVAYALVASLAMIVLYFIIAGILAFISYAAIGRNRFLS